MDDTITTLIKIINTTTKQDIIKELKSIEEPINIFSRIFDPPNFIKLNLENVSIYKNILLIGSILYNKEKFPFNIIFKDRISQISINNAQLKETDNENIELIKYYRKNQILLIKMYIKYGLDKIKIKDTDIKYLIENQNILIEKKTIFKEKIYFSKITNELSEEILQSKFNNNLFIELIGLIKEGEIINEIIMEINKQNTFYALLCCIKNYDLGIEELNNFLITRNIYFFSEEYKELKLFDISYHLNKKAIYYLLSKVRCFNYNKELEYTRNYMNIILNNYNFSFITNQMDNYLLYDVLINQFEEIDNMSYLSFLFTKKRESHLIDIINYLKEKFHRQFMYYLDKEEYIESVELLINESEFWIEKEIEENKKGYLIIKPKNSKKLFLNELNIYDLEILYEENQMDIPIDLISLSSYDFNNIKIEYKKFLKLFKQNLLKNDQIIKIMELKKMYNFKNYEESKKLRILQKNIIALFDFVDYHKNILAKDISMEYIKTKSCINEIFFQVDIYANKFIENILNLKYDINIADEIICKIYINEKNLFNLIIENIIKIFPLYNLQKQSLINNKDSYNGNVDTIKNLHFIAIFFGRILNYGFIKSELYIKCIIFLKDCFLSRNIKIIELGKVVLDHYPLIKGCEKWESIILEYNLFNNLEKIDDYGNLKIIDYNKIINKGIKDNLIFENNTNLINKEELKDIIKLISNSIFYEKLKDNKILKFLKPFDNFIRKSEVFKLRNDLIEFHLKYEEKILNEKIEDINFIEKLFKDYLNEEINEVNNIKIRYLTLKLMNFFIKKELNLSLKYLKNIGRNLGKLLSIQTIQNNIIYSLNIIDLMEYINLLIENKKIIFLVYFLIGFLEKGADNPIFDLLAPFSNKYIKIISIINNNMNYKVKKDIKKFLNKIYLSNKFHNIRSPNINKDNISYSINKEYLKYNYYSYNNIIRLNPYLTINRNKSMYLTNHLKGVLEKNNLLDDDFIYEITYLNSRYLKIASQEFVNYNIKNNEKINCNFMEKLIKEQLENLNYNLTYKLKGSRLVQRILKISIDFTISNIYEDIKLKINELLIPVMNNIIKNRYDFEEFYKNNLKGFELKDLKNKIYGEKKIISYSLFISCVDMFLKYLLINIFKVRLEKNIKYIFKRAKLSYEEIITGSFFKENFKTFNYIFLSKIVNELQIEMENQGFIFNGFGNIEYDFLFSIKPIKKLLKNNKIIMNSKEIEEKIDLLACHIPIEESTEINILIDQIKDIFSFPEKDNNNLINLLINKLKNLPNLDKNCINIAEEFMGILLKNFNIHLYSLILQILELSFKTKCLISDWIIYSDDERKLNIDLVSNLIKDGILNYQELDMFISRNLFTINNEKSYQTFVQKKYLDFLLKLLLELPIYYFIQSIQEIEKVNKKIVSNSLNEILLNLNKYGLEDIDISNFEEEYKKYLYEESNISSIYKVNTSLITISSKSDLIKEGIKSSMISYLKGNDNISKYKKLEFLISKYNTGDNLFILILEKLTEDLINQNYRFIDYYMFYILNSNNFEKFLKIIDLQKFPIFGLPILKILSSKISNFQFILIDTFKSINSICNFNSGCCYLINNKLDTEKCKCEIFKNNLQNGKNILINEKEFITLNINLILLLKLCPIDFPQFFNSIFNYFLILKFHFPKFFVKNSIKFNFFLEEKYSQLKNLFCSIDLILCKNCICLNSNKINSNDIFYSEEFHAKLNNLNIKILLNQKINRIDLHYLIREINDLNIYKELKKEFSEFNEEIFILSLVNNLGNKKPKCFDILINLNNELLNKILKNRLSAGNCTSIFKLACKVKNIKID